MKLTKNQKDAIRAHWRWYDLRFLKDGTVKARKSIGGAGGVLYTPPETRKHLEALGLI